MLDAIHHRPAQVLLPDMLGGACGMMGVTTDFDLRRVGQPKPGGSFGKLIT